MYMQDTDYMSCVNNLLNSTDSESQDNYQTRSEVTESSDSNTYNTLQSNISSDEDSIQGTNSLTQNLATKTIDEYQRDTQIYNQNYNAKLYTNSADNLSTNDVDIDVYNNMQREENYKLPKRI